MSRFTNLIFNHKFIIINIVDVIILILDLKIA